MLVIKKHTRPTISKQGHLAAYNFTVGVTPYLNRTLQESLSILQKYCRTLKMQLDANITWHLSLKDIRNTSYGMVFVSDFFAGAHMPDLAIWDRPKELLALADNYLVHQDINNTITALDRASRVLQNNFRLISDYADKNLSGYDQTMIVLKGVQTGASVGVAVLTTVVITPVAGPAAAAAADNAYEGFTKVVQQSIEVNINMRDKIDWAGIGIDTAVDTLMAIAAGKIAEKFIAALNTQNLFNSLPPAVQQQAYKLLNLPPGKLRDIIIKVVIDDMGDRLGHVLKYLMKSKQGTDRGITWSSISEAASDDFIQDNIKNISVETITSIIEKAVTHAK